MWAKYSKKKWAAIVIILLVVAGVGYYFYHLRGGLNNKENANLETAIAARGKITSAVSATGTVKPVNSVDISSEVSGLVKEIKVKENDYVKTGQTLAVLKDDALQTTLDKARYEVNNYRAKYNRINYLHSFLTRRSSDLLAQNQIPIWKMPS